MEMALRGNRGDATSARQDPDGDQGWTSGLLLGSRVVPSSGGREGPGEADLGAPGPPFPMT